MKRIFEKIVEGLLTCSGFLTSVTILLIIVFLFPKPLAYLKVKSLKTDMF